MRSDSFVVALGFFYACSGTSCLPGVITAYPGRWMDSFRPANTRPVAGERTRGFHEYQSQTHLAVKPLHPAYNDSPPLTVTGI